MYRQFYSWAGSNTLLLIYQTCIRPNLEYACQLWDPFLNKRMQSLEAVQKFACKVCLKQWDLDYDSMLQLLNLPRLSVRREYLVSGHMYFPPSIFVQSNLPYYLNRTSTFNFIRPFAHTNYMYHSFVPSVVSSWNNLPDSVKHCSSISSFKRSLLYHFEAHVPH